jgi:serine phosphatase RsbU (regulator of sigma subunit)/anti-sigma regulatory factor (Ser/Thr protein kinase)
MLVTTSPILCQPEYPRGSGSGTDWTRTEVAMDAVTFPGTLEGLSPIREYVKTAAEAAGLDESATFNLMLAVDEIATNIVEYGYREAGLRGDIFVGAARDSHSLVIRLTDTGKPYDPLAHPAFDEAMLTQSLEDRTVGGLGIMFARDGVDELQYESTAAGNTHRFVVRLLPAAESVPPTLSPAVADEHRKLEILLNIAKSLGKQIELDPLLQLIVAEVTAAMDAERTSLFLVSRAVPNELVTRVAEGGLGEQEILKELRIPFGVGIAGVTAQTREIINIPDAYEDRRFHREVDKISGFVTKAMLTAPIAAEDDRLIGVVQVLNKKGGGAFTKDDERFLDAICGNLSIALRRAEMVEEYLQTRIVATSLELARDIQMGLVPKDFPALPEFKEIDVYATMVPALEVGGDLYDYFPLDENRICFVIGDVSGKGIPAALFMAMARTAFKMAAMAGSESISATMERVNQFLCESNRSQMFVTALAGILDLQTGLVEYADAGHEPPLILRSSGGIQVVQKVPGIALGCLPQLSCRSGTLQLDRGDTLVLYTDGVTEAMNTTRQLFGADAMQRTLAKSGSTAGCESLVQVLLQDVRLFVGTARQSDDITILAIRYLGRGETAPQ